MDGGDEELEADRVADRWHAHQPFVLGLPDVEPLLRRRLHLVGPVHDAELSPVLVDGVELAVLLPLGRRGDRVEILDVRDLSRVEGID